jgi:hypothetical protein
MATEFVGMTHGLTVLHLVDGLRETRLGSHATCGAGSLVVTTELDTSERSRANGYDDRFGGLCLRCWPTERQFT